MTTDHPPAPRSRRDHRFLVVPAVTFIVGLALGAALVWVTVPGSEDTDGGDVAAPTPATTSSPADTGGRSVTVPEPCLQAVELSRDVLALTQKAAGAIGELDARELQGVVDELQGIEPDLRASADACEIGVDRLPATLPTTG